jgi:hypothetical protein
MGHSSCFVYFVLSPLLDEVLADGELDLHASDPEIHDTPAVSVVGFG